MNWLPEITIVVKVLGVGLCILGIGLCYKLSRVRIDGLHRKRMMNLGIVTISVVAFYKLMALVAFVGVPAASVGIANYHVFEGVKEVRSCNQCHVMRPMVNDMKDPLSGTLAARHYRNRWIANQQCYKCHTDYGLAGTLEAKMAGYRHLARYTTGTYTEPIEFRGVYNNRNCLQCHAGTEEFKKVGSHNAVWERLRTNSMSCLNCHGQAHPTRAQRTPGHSDYERLMTGEDG